MNKLLCWLWRHRLYDTGNRVGLYPVMRCRRCDRVWFNGEEILPTRYDRPIDNPWKQDVTDLDLLDYCVECGERFKESDDKAEVYETRVGGTGPYLVHADPCYMQNQAKYSLA